MRGRVYRGTTDSFSLWQPFIGARSLQKKGAPVGPKADVASMMFFHPFLLPTDATAIAIEGEMGSGKSAFGKSMTLRLSMMQAKNPKGEPESWRTRIGTEKSEGGAQEYRPLGNALHTLFHPLGHGNRINLIGLLKRPTDVINFTINVIQEIGQQRSDAKVSDAVTISTYKIFGSNPNVNGEAMLALTLRGLTLEDFIDYKRSGRERMMADFETEFKEDPRLKTQLNLEHAYDDVNESYLEAARFAASCLEELMGENFGGVFGGRESLYHVLTQRVVTLDTEDIPENARRMIESVLMKAEASAIRYKLEEIGTERDMTRIIPHWNLSDEEGGKMRGNLMHARYLANAVAKGRAYTSARCHILQYGTQMTKVGGDSDELRSLGEEIDNGFGIRIIFRQPYNTDYLHRYSKLGMSDQDIEKLPFLNTGEAMLWVKGHPTVRFQHILLEKEVPLIDSTSARRRVSETTPVWTTEQWKERQALYNIHNNELTTSNP